jgi:hypothetical protein
MSYDLNEHRHRFAVWAAARAAQRGFTTVGNLRAALECTDIRKALLLPATLRISASEFDKQHERWCSAIQAFLGDRKIRDASYGRAAKLVAVYLKVAIILGDASNSSLASHAHPPIDRILLHALASSDEIKSEHKRAWTTINWTDLDGPRYRELIGQLRAVVPVGAPFWSIERYWQPPDGDEAL